MAIGAYQPGSDPALDTALSHRPQIERFLRQPVRERSDPNQTDATLLALGASLATELELRSGEIPDAEEVIAEPDGGAEAGAGANAGASAGAGAVAIDPSAAPAIPALGLSI